MNRKCLCTLILVIGLCLTLTACAAPGNEYRPGSDVRGDLDKKRSAKFILQVGQRGFVTLDGGEHGFELLRMNSMSNVTIQLLDSGEQLELSAQLPKKVRLSEQGVPVTFELSTTVREMAVIYARVERDAATPAAAPAAAAPAADKVALHLKVLAPTTVTLTLDDQPAQSIPLPGGTEVTWTARERLEIQLPEADRAVVEINGAIHRPGAQGRSQHLLIQRKAQGLVIESR